MTRPGPAWREGPDGIELRVRVTPRATRDAVEGFTEAAGEPVLKVRVRAAPAEGAANEAVRRLLSTALGTPVSAVRLLAGAGGRVKRFSVQGDTAALAAALGALG